MKITQGKRNYESVNKGHRESLELLSVLYPWPEPFSLRPQEKKYLSSFLKTQDATRDRDEQMPMTKSQRKCVISESLYSQQR